MTTQDDGTTNNEVIDNNVAKWLRASTPAERIQMAGALNEMGRRNLAKSVSEVIRIGVTLKSPQRLLAVG